MHSFWKNVRMYLVCALPKVAGTCHLRRRFISSKMYILKQAFAVCLMIAAVSCGCCSIAKAEESGSALLSFEAACQQATVSHKLVAIEFFSRTSAESNVLHDHLLSQPEVAQLLSEEYVLVSLEQKENEALARRYAIKRLPTVVLIKADGTEIDRIGRWVNKAQFMAFLRAGMQGRSEISELVQRVNGGGAAIAAHISLADAYMRRYRDSEALLEYRWCIENGQEVDNKVFRQNSKDIIRGLIALGTRLQTATVALRDFRKRVAIQCQSKPEFERYMVLFSCNDALRESAHNVDTYRALPATSPLRAQLLSSVFPNLIRRRMYEDIVSAVDLEDFVNMAYLSMSAGLPSEMDNKTGLPPEVKESASDVYAVRKRLLLDRAVASVEALLATGQTAKAQRIAGRILDSDGSHRLQLRLLEAGRRSGNAEIDAFSSWVNAYNMPDATRPKLQ